MKRLSLFASFLAVVGSRVVPVCWGQEQTLVLQPGPEGKNAYICNCKPDTVSPAGDPAHLWQGYLNQPPAYNRCSERFLVQWDLSKLPEGATVVSAKMELYCDYLFGAKAGQMVFRRATEPWEEASATWNTQPANRDDVQTVTDWPANKTWHSVDVMKFVEGWHKGSFPNRGIVAMSTGTGDTTCSAAFYSCNFSDARLRPKLTITYLPRVLVLDITPGAGGGIALTWSAAAPKLLYTVEFSTSLMGPDWGPVPPIDQWPITGTKWTDSSVVGSGVRFYRIRTEGASQPRSAGSENR